MEQLSEETVQAIVELRKAKVRREREDLINRLEEKVKQIIQHHRQKGDYVPNDASDQKLAEEIIAAYVSEMPGDEATFP